jgi:excisionase family DNA binding protein
MRETWEFSEQPAPRPDPQDLDRIDLLELGALALRVPTAVMTTPGAGRTWKVSVRGLPSGEAACVEPLISAIAAAGGPVEYSDLSIFPALGPLLSEPHCLRWAYGSVARARSGTVNGVVAVLDRAAHDIGPSQRTAMVALIRRLDAIRSTASGAPNDGPGKWRPPEWQAGSLQHDPAVEIDISSPTARLLHTRDVASTFNVTERTVMNWAASGRLHAVRTLGGQLRFRQGEVECLTRLQT